MGMGSCAEGDVVWILVLGDLGHSPRMNYHALSLAQEGYRVRLLGHTTSSAIPTHTASNNRISVHPIREPPKALARIPRLLAYPLKVAWQALFLTCAFISLLILHPPRPKFILLQNPPGIPALPVTYLFSIVLSSTLIIDWHNYGHSLMALQHGPDRWIVRLAKWIEDTFASKAHRHITVTKAMRQDLHDRLNIQAVTLYDRPPPFFKPLQESEKRQFLSKLSKEYSILDEVLDNWSDDTKRPGILLSSTSWTEDEDFDLLLTSLQEYERVREEGGGRMLPKLVVFITGKGPLKDYYKAKIKDINFSSVRIETPWLEQEDYPKLLGCADVGVSLHYSSSGLDLPMKVVDMFGCGLPVFAAHFNCIQELVKHEENGLVFHDAKELGEQIQDWFKMGKNPRRSKFRENLKTFQSIRWHQNWQRNAQPLFS